MTATMSAYAGLCEELRSIATLGSVAGLVGWDQETYMPARAAGFRAEQQAALASLIHERRTSARLRELIEAASGEAASVSEAAVANVREARLDYERSARLPNRFVAEEARLHSQAQEAWKEARRDADFSRFRPWLDRVIAMAREKADFLMREGMGERYDALLDLYEPATTAEQIAAVFTPLRDRLSAFIREIAETRTAPDTSILSTPVAPEAQHRLGLAVLGAIGFDLDAGRLDTTVHPFCSGFAPGDTRLTTRYERDRFIDALYGTMHEGGHGLYEQGLPKLPAPGRPDVFGQPLSEAVSLGIHESQSRTWENLVGRSHAFWRWLFPIADDIFGGALSRAGGSVDVMARAVNTCRPTLIRVEADEGTYNLHVMIRFEIERAMIRGDLDAADVPGAWNDAYRDLLGLEVPDDREGCLQDVHWSFGLVGYFPTYTLGNLYAAQLWEQACEDIPGLEEGFASGSFRPLLDWVRTRIHEHGRRYTASELCERITGRPLEADPLLRHLRRRVAPAYGL